MDYLKVCDLTVAQIKWLKTFYECISGQLATGITTPKNDSKPLQSMTFGDVEVARARANEEHDALPQVPFNVQPRPTWRMTPGVNSEDEIVTLYDVRTVPKGELIKECRTAHGAYGIALKLNYEAARRGVE